MATHECPQKISAQSVKNWFQYVRRVYTTAINFPCLTFYITLSTYFDGYGVQYKEYLLYVYVL